MLMLLFACKEKEANRNYLNETVFDKDARMEWWREARFGMFIHWGVYSVPAGVYEGRNISGTGEWLMSICQIPIDTYKTFSTGFNPQKYNALEWVRMAKNAGMKYIVITTKHHDGFCMWDSKYTDWDIIDATPYKKDVIKEFADACKQEGMKLGFYHSLLDWAHADAKGEKFASYRENYLKPQLKELLTNYGEISILWFDGDWIDEWTNEQGSDLYNFVRNLQPNILVNNRVTKGRNGMQGMSVEGEFAGDFGTPEQEILNEASTLDWEACMTMNDTWGFKLHDENWKTTAFLIFNLVDACAKGGNYLLNVGPTSEGLIPQASVERLNEMGEWLNRNAEAIYGSKRTDIKIESSNMRYTQSKTNKHIYATVFGTLSDSVVLKSVSPLSGSKITLLGFDENLKWRWDNIYGLVIYIPENLKNGGKLSTIANVFKMEATVAKVTQSPVISTIEFSDVKKALFNQKEEIILTSINDDAEIFYTTDGSIPNLQSTKYISSFEISNSCTLKTIALSKGAIISSVSEAVLKQCNTFSRLDLKNKPSVNYPAQGYLTLADSARGSLYFKDGAWLGFESVDFEADIDLGKSKKITSVSTGFLQDLLSAVFLPIEYTVFLSHDGINFREAGKVNHTLDKNEMQQIRTFKIDIKPTKARFVRIVAKNVAQCPDWHSGAGGKASLFADEIIIE